MYCSEQPSLTFLKDTDGDGKADVHQLVLTGFGTEDSHHALHDFAWSPDGDLIFRNQAKTRFVGERFEHLYRGWKAGRVTQADIRQEFGGTNRPVIAFQDGNTPPIRRS